VALAKFGRLRLAFDAELIEFGRDENDGDKEHRRRDCGGDEGKYCGEPAK